MLGRGSSICISNDMCSCCLLCVLWMEVGILMKLYWRMYQDKESTKYTSVVLTEEEMKKEVKGFF